tara:strand:+ start:236 stop:454 length:219 start_codon:yes stop_codon:yes gene_type:complete
MNRKGFLSIVSLVAIILLIVGAIVSYNFFKDNFVAENKESESLGNSDNFVDETNELEEEANEEDLKVGLEIK